MKQHLCKYEESHCPVDTGVQKQAVETVDIVNEGGFPQSRRTEMLMQ
jgi:hypothetical protein